MAEEFDSDVCFETLVRTTSLTTKYFCLLLHTDMYPSSNTQFVLSNTIEVFTCGLNMFVTHVDT